MHGRRGAGVRGGALYRFVCVPASGGLTESSWDGVPATAFDNLAKLSVVLDEIIDEYQMDAIAIRCWLELQKQLGISPCVVLGNLNDQGIGAACEVDLGSAIALQPLASAQRRSW